MLHYAFTVISKPGDIWACLTEIMKSKVGINELIHPSITTDHSDNPA